MLGRAGFLPLGQALFFGIAAYISGYVLRGAADWFHYVPGFIAAILVPTLLAWIVGVLAFDRQSGSGPYFSLITLALCMLGAQLANSMDWLTGGFNGLTGIEGLPGVDTYSQLYYIVVLALAVTTYLLGHVYRLPFGQLLEAVRENEDRLALFGFRTGRLKALAFALSAAVAGLAGALYAPLQGIVTPQALGFQLSADMVIWTAVGGRFGVLGPVVGSVAIGFLASGLRDSFQYWEIAVALVFLVVVLKLPGGLGGLTELLAERLGWSFFQRKTLERTQIIEAKKASDGAKLEFDKVNVRMGPVAILNGLSFTIDRPGIHCIIGPNGAGKTSAFNVMTGKLPVKAGHVTWRGLELHKGKTFAAAKKGVGRKLQVPSIFAGMTIAQNLDLGLWANRLKGVRLFSYRPYRWKTMALAQQLHHFDFLTHPETRAGSLSVGQRQMLDLAMTMLAEPELVLLDEPCAGLSTTETERMINAIAAMAAGTHAIFVIIEHDMQVVERLSNHVFVFHQGALLASGRMDEIKTNDAVKRVYSGGTK